MLIFKIMCDTILRYLNGDMKYRLFYHERGDTE